MHRQDPGGRSVRRAGRPTTYAALCRSVGIHRARHTLVSGDGAEWIPVMVREWFPDAIVQLDHFHLKQKLRLAAGGDVDLAGRWISWALSGRWPSLARSMTHLVARGRLEPKLARDTLAFLELNHSAIWAFRRLQAQGAPRELYTRGSGVVEHNIDLVAARRMKRQGMRWSRRGAHHMLALRCLLVEPAAWSAWWKEVVGGAPASPTLKEKARSASPKERGGQRDVGVPTAY
ncbi:MAG: UPF0236 family transposase-like protein [Actinomycetota bacterium]